MSLADIVTLHGVRVTTVLRTTLDLGCKLRRRHALASMDGLLRVGGLTADDLRPELARFWGRRGVVQLRDLVERADPDAESPGESWLRLAIVDAGLPKPVSQYWVRVSGVDVYRLDLAYPRLRVCAEYDGEETHSDADQRAYDDRRREWLRDRGWTVIVVRHADLFGESLDRWLGELRAAIADAERSTFRPGRFDIPTSRIREI